MPPVRWGLIEIIKTVNTFQKRRIKKKTPHLSIISKNLILNTANNLKPKD